MKKVMMKEENPKGTNFLPKMYVFFCGRGNDELHQVTTLEVDENVRMMATELQDTDLHAKLASGDMIATESMYHRKCMTSLKNRYRSLLREKNVDHSSEDEQIAEARTFTELVSYMESSVESGKKNFSYLSYLNYMFLDSKISMSPRTSTKHV